VNTISLIRTGSMAALFAAAGALRAAAPPQPPPLAPLLAQVPQLPQLPQEPPVPQLPAAAAAATTVPAAAVAAVGMAAGAQGAAGPGTAAPGAPRAADPDRVTIAPDGASTVAATGLAPVPARAARLGATPVDAALLADARGGDDTSTVATTANVHGAVGANSATNVATGSNTIAGASFANAVGLPVVIQNSGANVLIQNATVINLQLR
jgi:hypothetical protein